MKSNFTISESLHFLRPYWGASTGFAATARIVALAVLACGVSGCMTTTRTPVVQPTTGTPNEPSVVVIQIPPAQPPTVPTIVPIAKGSIAQTNDLDTYRIKYDAKAASIADDIQQQKKNAFAQYGTDLDSALRALKEKGDIDGYTIVEQEAKRFRTDKMVLTNASHPDIAKAIAAYQKRLLAADDDLANQNAALLKFYIRALNDLVKSLMTDNKIEDARAAATVKKSAESRLADIQSRKPDMSVKPTVHSEVPQPKVPASTATEKEPGTHAAMLSSIPANLRTGLVLHYSFDEDQKASITDKSGHGNHGRASGVEYRKDGKGAACEFDGNGSIETVHSAGDFSYGKSDFTWSLWVKPSNLGPQTLLAHVWNPEVRLIGGKVQAVCNGSHSQGVLLSSTALSQGEWYSIVFLRSKGIAHLFINGKNEASVDASDIDCSADGPLQMGKNVNSRMYFTGLLDEIMIYRRALSEAEVAQLYGLSVSDFHNITVTPGGDAQPIRQEDVPSAGHPRTPGPIKTSVYLSDLPEVSVSGCTTYGLVKGPLDTWAVNGKVSRKGILACAPSELVYDIGTLQMNVLDGLVGIGRVNPNSKMQFHIYGDETLLWESPIMTQAKKSSESMTERFTVDITNVRQIKLVVDPLGSVNSDHSIWVDPRLSRKR
jgi:hypothetical protein